MTVLGPIRTVPKTVTRAQPSLGFVDEPRPHLLHRGSRHGDNEVKTAEADGVCWCLRVSALHSRLRSSTNGLGIVTSSSDEVTSTPRIPVAFGVDPDRDQGVHVATRPFSHTLRTRSSAGTNVYGPASSGRLRIGSTWAPRSLAITETCDYDNEVMPRESTRFSIRRVDTASR